MKVPIECGLVQKLDMVSGCNAAKGFHGFPEKLPAVPIQRVVVVKESCGQVMRCCLNAKNHIGTPFFGIAMWFFFGAHFATRPAHKT